MPRDGGGVYSYPAGGVAVSGETISSTAYNARSADVLDDLNTARPIVYGGTGATSASAARTALGVQASDALLTAISALTTSADTLLKFTGVDTCAVISASDARTLLGLATGDSPQFTAINLGHASNTTLGQGSAAGLGAIEGVDLVDISTAQSISGKKIRPAAGTDTSGALSAANCANTVVALTGNPSIDPAGYTANDFIILVAGGSARTITRGGGAMYVLGSDVASATLQANQMGVVHIRSTSVMELAGAIS